MTVETLCHQLQCLGWQPLEEGRQSNGCWRVLTATFGHAILAYADNPQEAWSAACSMAMKVTLDGMTRH